MSDRKVVSECPGCDDGLIYEDDPVNTGLCVECTKEGK